MKLQPQFSFKTGYEHNSPYHNKFLDISPLPKIIVA